MPPPRTRMTGVIPRRAQVLDRGRLRTGRFRLEADPAAEAAAVLLCGPRSESFHSSIARRRARSRGARRLAGPRGGAAGTRSRDGVLHPGLPGDQVADAGQRPPLVLVPGGQRPGIQHRIQRRQLLLIQPAPCGLAPGRQPGHTLGQPGLPPPPHRPLTDPQLSSDHSSDARCPNSSRPPAGPALGVFGPRRLTRRLAHTAYALHTAKGSICHYAGHH